jgi:SAM-dependent methyltransferase
MSDIPAPAAAERTVKQITLLMPVWGYRFIGRFLEFCLPTLLAPNNIPALAKALPCRFVLLSSAADEPIIRSHPALQKLEGLCTVEIHPIDDLITEGNHTATITLAFERALRQAGAAMRDTCFIFLMSDYIVADGSLQTVLRTVQRGAGAVLAGNFQVTAEDAAPLLRRRVELASHEIVLPPRELVQWSLGHLHPATVANIVNFGLTHNNHTNRLFWRVDEDTLIGRFYLMHPIAIHPEVADFVVSASWDYSFVPELCPSGNVVALTDSDDYLVVELQRRDYEWENLRPGPVRPAALARSLAEWTTDDHRRNVAQILVFHGGERPADLPQVVAQSDAFLDSVRQALAAPPLRHRRHPYWVGSIAVNRQRSHRPLDRDDWSFLLGERTPPPTPWLQHMRARLFGFPPGVTRLHPLWPDYARPFAAISDVLAANGRVLLVAQDCEPFAPWLVGATGDVATLNADHLLQLTRAQYSEFAGAFDACLLLAGDAMLERADELIEHIAPLLKAGGRIILTVIGSLAAEDATESGRNFTSQAGQLLNRSVGLDDIQYVELSPWRLATRSALMRRVARSGMGVMAPAALPAALINYFANLTARIDKAPPPGAWSSVCVTLRVSAHAAPFPRRFAQEAALDRTGPVNPIHADELPTPVGLPTPALRASRLWQDPAQPATQLALYRFVAALVGARHDIAEYGCASAAGTRLALQQFRKVTVFDPRAYVVDDLQWRFQDNWRFEARQHDILSAPLPRQVDSIYCVDFIQYVSRDEEEDFIRKLSDSLAGEANFLLIGSPSYGTGRRAAAAARKPTGIDTAPGHPADCAREQPSGGIEAAASVAAGDTGCAPAPAMTYRRTAPELKALMQRFFENVFVFSMVDGAAQPGIEPDAQHVFALGCGKKS